MGERVMVQMQGADGKKAQSHIGCISAILEDKITVSADHAYSTLAAAYPLFSGTKVLGM